MCIVVFGLDFCLKTLKKPCRFVKPIPSAFICTLQHSRSTAHDSFGYKGFFLQNSNLSLDLIKAGWD